MSEQNHGKNQLGHFRRFGPAAINSWKGAKAAYKYEVAFRQELFLFIVLTPIAFVISDGFVEFAILVGAIFGIIVAELLNSAVEAVVDRVGLEHHELSGRAKDLGSAAVAVAIGYFLLVWGYKLYLLYLA